MGCVDTYENRRHNHPKGSGPVVTTDVLNGTKISMGINHVGMNIIGDRSVSHVLERDVDLVVVQLLKTDPIFRCWFFQQLNSDSELKQFLGVERSVTETNGESDIVFGVETSNDRRWLGLIENKIDAEKQERQAERYFERGKKYIEGGSWDNFHVALIAPRRYVGKAEREEFQTVVLYEELLDCVEELNHTGAPFLCDVFESALERRSGTDHSSLTSTISQHLAASPQLPDIERPSVTPTQVEIHSRHPDHPDSVYYKVYLPGPKDGNMAVVRLQIRSDTPNEEIDHLRSVLAPSIGELDEFEYEPNNIMNTVWTEIWRQDDSVEGKEVYVERIIDAVHELLGFYHPKLVENLNTG